jgi:hypothetical protein
MISIHHIGNVGKNTKGGVYKFDAGMGTDERNRER